MEPEGNSSPGAEPDARRADPPTTATQPAGRRWGAALSGLLAGGVALGTGELAAGLGKRIPSLVVAVGDVVVDWAPVEAVRTSIEIFGTNDKPALLVGIVVLSLLIGSALGVASLTRRWIGVAGFVAFGSLGAWAGLRDPQAADAAAITVAVVASAAGIGALLLLLRALPSPQPPPAPQEGAEPAPDSVDRRRFVRMAAGAAAAGVAGAVVGRWIGARDSVEAARADVELPDVAGSLLDQSDALSAEEVPGLSPLFTPNDDFYRIDTALVVPQVDPAGWRLRFTGMVDTPFEMTFDELLARPMMERDITLSCVSNEVGGDLVGNARWLGVPLQELLAEAGVQPAATQVVGESVDGFTVGFPTAVLDGDRPALVAVGMNGEPLPAAHGFPARLVVSGLYGYVSATKWLAEVRMTTLEDFDGYWIPRGWAKEGPVKTQSRIDVPRSGRTVPAGPTAVAGVAWAPSRDITRVEVRVNDGEWVPARLGERLSADSWRQWVHIWDAPRGRHRLSVRATDGTGEVQTELVQSPAPDGATGHHTIRVFVD